MNRIEWIWNLIFYSMFRWVVRFNNLLNLINPFYWINRKTSVKERHAINGFDEINKFKDDILNNYKSGLSLYPVYFFIGGLFIVIELSVLNIILLIFRYPLSNILESTSLEFIVFGVMFIIAVCHNHVVLYKDNKYLNYFEKFNKLSNKRKLINDFICFIVMCIITLLFFVTLSLL